MTFVPRVLNRLQDQRMDGNAGTINLHPATNLFNKRFPGPSPDPLDVGTCMFHLPACHRFKIQSLETEISSGFLCPLGKPHLQAPY